MIHVVFVAPYFGANMLHVLRCLASLDAVRLGVVTQEPAERLPVDLKGRVEGHYQVSDCGDVAQLVAATRAFCTEWGRVDRLECYLEQMQVPLGDARDALGIDGLGGGAARNFRDKNRMKAVLAAHGLPVARQALVHSSADARRFIDEVGTPVVLKPIDGAGARGTMRVTDEASLDAALEGLSPSPASPCQAEEFVQGDEHTFETVTLEGRQVWWSSTFYLPGPLQVLENPWMQYCLLLPKETMAHEVAFRDTNFRALQALGMQNGLSHMEWFLRPGGAFAIGEVGARPPGANILLVNSYAHDTDFWAAWAKLVALREWSMPARSYASGCAFIRGQGRGNVVKAVHGLEAAQEKIGPCVMEAKLPRPGQPHSTHYEGDGWVVVRHPETQGVIDALRVLVTDVYVALG